MRRLARLGIQGFAVDQLQQTLFQGEGRLQQLFHALGLAHADQLVEQLVHVFGQRHVRGQDAVVGVQAGVAGVIVTGAQVHVAFQVLLFAAQDQHHLGVGLEADHAVDHHGTGLLQAAGQLQVGFLVKARPQLDHHGHFLAVTGGIDQRVDDLGVGPGAVQRLLDRQHVRVLRGLTQQVDHRAEGLVGMLQQDVLLADRLEQVVGARQHAREARTEGRKLQLRVVFQAGNGEQARQVDRAVNLVQLGLGQTELLEQKVGQRFRAVVGHLKAYRVAVAA